MCLSIHICILILISLRNFWSKKYCFYLNSANLTTSSKVISQKLLISKGYLLLYSVKKAGQASNNKGCVRESGEQSSCLSAIVSDTQKRLFSFIITKWPCKSLRSLHQRFSRIAQNKSLGHSFCRKTFDSLRFVSRSFSPDSHRRQ